MNKELIRKVESLKNMMVSRACGGSYIPQEYIDLRDEFISNPKIAKQLPELVQTCRYLDEFWGVIKPKFAHYNERREFIGRAFAPLLLSLESERSAPGDKSTSAVIEVMNSEHIRNSWLKALERRNNDPEGAITAARTLLETVCKHILDELGITYKDEDDLPKLYNLAANQLKLSPSQHSEVLFKQILGNCQSVVGGLGALRNRFSDAHGRGKVNIRPAPRHAELAVNLAGSVAAFLIQTFEERRR